jgi:hypothetical protein
VNNTARTNSHFVLRLVASTARGNELLLIAAVDSTDRSLSHLVACQECSLFDGIKARRSQSALDAFVTEVEPS